MNNALLERIKKAGSIKTAETISKSSFFNDKDMIQTDIPALNIALSGKLEGGLTPGLTILAGPSRHFKSMFGLIMVKSYMKRYPESICLFIDSEFGITPDYISTIGIDTDRVLHVPVEHIEQLKFDLVKRLEEINRGDKVIIFIDSIGNLASKKEVEDALDGKSVADMTRAKTLKGLFRIITPHFATKDIPCIVVNHTYQEQALYPKTIMSGGTGPMYSANTVFFIGKQQEKDGTELAGWNFIINVEKSRYVKEKSKIPVTVTFDGGLSKWSGLLEMALEAKLVVKPSNGWYSRVDVTTGEIEDRKWRLADTDSKEFWLPVLTSKAFQIWVKNNYQVGSGQMMSDESIDEELANVEEDDEAIQDS
jgi:RecA/RadA recombinase